METHYNRIAGQSLERLAALSDGIFAVAMTLLVLDLRVPALDVIHSQQVLWTSGALQSEQTLWAILIALSPKLLTYFMSFMTLGIFWLGQQTQLDHFDHSNRRLAWIHLAFLCAVTLMPFSTSLLAEYITFRLALLVYWLNLLFLGIMLYTSLRYGERAGLLNKKATAENRATQKRRIIVYQVLYGVAIGLCVINTYVSLVALILLQLNSVISPSIWPLNKF